MTDIYLSYSEPNLALAQDLKKDVESCSSLSVALLEDWEEDAGYIQKAKLFILIAAEHSNITAWVMDHHHDQKRRKSIMPPPTLDFSSSYEEGMLMLKYVLRVVTGARRFQTNKKRGSSNLLKRDEKPKIPQRQKTEPRIIEEEEDIFNENTIMQEPTRFQNNNANQSPQPPKRRSSSLLELVSEHL